MSQSESNTYTPQPKTKTSSWRDAFELAQRAEEIVGALAQIGQNMASTYGQRAYHMTLGHLSMKVYDMRWYDMSYDVTWHIIHNSLSWIKVSLEEVPD